MKHIRKKIFLLLGVAVFLTGCAQNKTFYHWGHYEGLLYSMYANPGEAESGMQIGVLIQDIEEAEGLGKKVPPGVYAHLGFMYAIEGQVSKSEEAFDKEIMHFPESADFINGMRDRAKKG